MTCDVCDLFHLFHKSSRVGKKHKNFIEIPLNESHPSQRRLFEEGFDNRFQ